MKIKNPGCAYCKFHRFGEEYESPYCKHESNIYTSYKPYMDYKIRRHTPDEKNVKRRCTDYEPKLIRRIFNKFLGRKENERREILKVFILEDDPRRMTYFRETYGDDQVIWIEEAQEAMDYLKDNYESLDRIYLDHDLGGEQYVDSSVFNTGYTVAKFMSEELNVTSFSNVTIHSMNHEAAKKMEKLLSGSKRIPFHNIYERIVPLKA